MDVFIKSSRGVNYPYVLFKFATENPKTLSNNVLGDLAKDGIVHAAICSKLGRNIERELYTLFRYIGLVYSSVLKKDDINDKLINYLLKDFYIFISEYG